LNINKLVWFDPEAAEAAGAGIGNKVFHFLADIDSE
jgi:hypothetical protein